MEKPQSIDVQSIVDNAINERNFKGKVEISKTRTLLKAIKSHAGITDGLEGQVELGEIIMILAKKGSISPEVVCSLRNEMYDDVLEILTTK